MPRKKSTQKPLGELLGVRMPQPDQDFLLAILDELPPIVYWAQCQTDDQKDHYLHLKQGYQFLKEELQRYFSGQGSLLPQLPQSDLNFFGALLGRYLAWYGVVQVGWQYIEAELVDAGMTIEDIQAGCPGEALIRVIENECAAFMSPAFVSYNRYSPSQDRRLATVQRKIRQGTADEKSIKRYDSQTKQNLAGMRNYFLMTDALIDICERNSQKNKPLQAAIKTYKKAMGEVEREVAAQHRERKGRKGFEWKNGIKSELARG